MHPIESTSIKVQRSEVPYYVNKAKVLTRKKVNKKGETNYEYSVKRDGNFVLTDKRLMIIDEGTTSVKYSDIADVEIDLDNKTLLISKSTSSIPVIIQTDRPFYIGKVIDLLAFSK